jgi:hypothetical protein
VRSQRERFIGRSLIKNEKIILNPLQSYFLNFNLIMSLMMNAHFRLFVEAL